MSTPNRIAIFLFVLSLTVGAQAQKGVKTKAKAKTVANCKSGNFKFPCPDNYSILLNGSGRNSLFLAKNREYRYGVFVADPKETVNLTIFENAIIKAVTKSFYPGESQKFRWKDIEADSRKTSNFETKKHRVLGFNGDRVVTLDFRYINRMNRALLTGTIVDGFTRGKGAENEFNRGSYTTNGGCFDALNVIRIFTKEEDSDDTNPCIFTLISQ